MHTLIFWLCLYKNLWDISQGYVLLKLMIKKRDITGSCWNCQSNNDWANHIHHRWYNYCKIIKLLKNVSVGVETSAFCVANPSLTP